MGLNMPLRTVCSPCGTSGPGVEGVDNIISSNAFPVGGIPSNQLVNRTDLGNMLFAYDALVGKYLSVSRYTEPFGRSGVMGSNQVFRRINGNAMIQSGIPLRDDLNICITDLLMDFDEIIDMNYQINLNGFQTIYNGSITQQDYVSDNGLNIVVPASTKFIAIRTGLITTGTLRDPQGTLVYALTG